MGYTTDFEGSLKISRPLTQKQVKYINLLSETRRMKRDVNKLMELYKGKHGNPMAKDKTNAADVYGHEGEYFAKDDGNFGQGDDGSVLDNNLPPGHKGWYDKDIKMVQPGLWCQWEISVDGTELEWNGGEKFYNYTDWLKYLIKNFFKPWGRKLNGEIDWFGEDRTDLGRIVVKNNEVKILVGEVDYRFNEEDE